MEEQRQNDLRSEITLRDMEDADLPRVFEIELACHPHDAWPDSEFTERLVDSREFCLVTEVNGEIAGFVIYRRRWFKLHLESVAVHPSYRRQGIARHMVKHLIEDLPRQGRSRIVLEVRKSNTAAQACYLQLGFRVVGQKERYYWPDEEDALLMRYSS